MKAPLPPNEDERLQTLLAYNVLDTEAEHDIDGLTQIASYICQTPIALVSLIDENRQWFKSKVGIDADQTPREQAFCAHAILADEVLFVPDATQDERFADNPLVLDDPAIRFYAGAPLIAPNGHALGTLCVIDDKPRDLTSAQLQALKMLARHVISQLELRSRIAELKDVTAELQRTNDAVNRASQAKSEFLTSMSHELRTPLNAIIGFTDGLLARREKHPLSEYQENRLERVNSAGQHLLALINDVLDIAKVEAGQMPLNPATFEIKPLIMEVGDLAEPLVGEKQGIVEFSIDVEDDLGSIHTDRDKVKQVLVNLLSNAIKFTNAGCVKLVVQRHGDELQFSVEDSGVGIAAEEIHKVFEKFHQVGNVHQQGGTGLGLSLCKHFADALGGKLTVRSVKDHGSTFTLSLPALPPSCSVDDREIIEHIKRRMAEHPSIVDGTRVMCVEDNPNNMMLMQDYLIDAGYSVIPVLDSLDATTTAEREQPDLIILDVMMPGLDGWELLRRFKSNPKTGHIPIVLATAIDDSDLGFSLGADDYLTKPIDKGLLVESIQRLSNNNQSDANGIAVVDDDPTVREILSDMLASEGLVARCFEDGQSFIEALEDWQPTTVLLDLMMPDVDGFSVIKQMGQCPEWRAIPTIVLTASILSSKQLLELNKNVLRVIEKNGMSRETTLKSIKDHLTVIRKRGAAA